MKKILLICILTGLLFTRTGAQHVADERRYPDSLQQLLDSTHAKSIRIKAHYLLSDYWSTSDTTKAFAAVREGLALSQGDSYYTGMGHYYLGGVYFDIDIKRAQDEYVEADRLLSRYHTHEALEYRARVWNNYGIEEQKKDNIRGYADILVNKVLPLAERSGDSVRLGICYLNLAVVFINLTEYTKTREYATRAISLLEPQKVAYADLADAYVYCAKAWILAEQPLKAKSYLDKAWKILAPNPESPYLPLYYGTEGMYYSRTGQYQAALNSLEKGIDLSTKLGQPFEVRSMVYEQYIIYKLQKNYPAAKQALLKEYKLQEHLPSAKDRRLLLYELAQTDKALGNTAGALEWMTQYGALADSIYATTTRADVAALETKYNTAEKEKRILRLEHEKQIAEGDRRYQQLLYGAVIAVLLLVLVLVFLLLEHRRRIAKKREEDHRNELSRIERDKRLSNYAAVVEGQEQERQRLAKDLHDGLGCMLSAVKLNLSGIVLQQPATSNNGNMLEPVISQLDNSITELRRISRNMMPESLLKLGLEASLKDMCAAIRSPELKVVFNAFNIDTAIPMQTQVVIYRTIQEIITNALKHARANIIMLQCSEADGTFFITVEDNGVGFNPDAGHEGIGLKNIRNRVALLKGNITIDSSKEGTIINIELNVGEQ